MSDAIVFGPKDLPVYEALAARLAAKEDWKELARVTRSMLRALVGGANPEAEASLWRRLRSLYQERLSDPKSALLAGEHLAKHDSTNVDDRIALARLYAVNGNAYKAGKVYEELVAHDPTNLVVVRELLANRLPQYQDYAWCAMSILAHAGALTEGERAFHEARKPSRLPTGRLVRNEWGVLEPPGANGDLDLFFTSLAGAIFEVAKKHPFPPDRADPRFVPPALASPLFSAAFACAVEAFGLPAQRHFAQPEPAASAEAGAPPSGPPSSGVLGPVVDDALRELLFVAGRQAAYHRPSHLVLYAFRSIPELIAFFCAGRLIVRPDAEVPSSLASFCSALAIDLQGKLSKDARYSLGVALERLDCTRITSEVLRRWRDAQDLFAARFGLLLCGDLAIAKKVLQAEERPADALPPDAVMRDLCGFAAQGMYAHYRGKLGLGADADVVVH